MELKKEWGLVDPKDRQKEYLTEWRKVLLMECWKEWKKVLLTGYLKEYLRVSLTKTAPRMESDLVQMMELTKSLVNSTASRLAKSSESLKDWMKAL